MDSQDVAEKPLNYERSTTVTHSRETSLQTFLLRRGFEDFLVSSNANALDISCYANALDDKHFSSNAGDAIRGRGETKYRENESERSLCQISHDICTKGTISVPSVKTGQGDGRA